MKKIINTLIADDNYELWNLIKACLSEYSDINVLDYVSNGFETLEMIQLLSPDVLILDIVMPNLDGLAVLERLNSMKIEKRPIVIILSAIDKDSIIQKAMLLGADYYILKPFEIDVMATRIRQLFKEKYFYPEPEALTKNETVFDKNTYEKDKEFQIVELLYEFGIPSHLLGCKYLKESIWEASNAPDNIKSMIKDLYETVAEKFNVTPQKVERSMRNAIEIAWQKGESDALDYLLGYSQNFSKNKPTNSEFISMMVNRLKTNLKNGT